MTIKCQREEFDIPSDIAYFNVAGVSPLLKSSHAHGSEGLRVKLHPWKINNEHFFTQVERLKSSFGALIGSPASQIAIIPSATYGIETALNNISLKPGDEILIQAEEFPALVLPIKKFAVGHQANIVTVPRPIHSDWTESFLSHMNEKTKLVAFGMSHWTDGSTLNGIVVSEKARSLGASVIVDVCQSAGAVPLNVKELDPDYLVAPTYKWLLGPYNCGFLYVAPRNLNGQPLEEYWASRVGADNFANLTTYEERYAEGAARFDMSERSQFVGLPVAQDAIDRIAKWTPGGISNYLRPICDEIAEHAEKMGYVVPRLNSRSPHFVGIKNPKGVSETEKESFLQNNIFLSFRGEWMRISPHIFIEQKDVDKLLSHLKRI